MTDIIRSIAIVNPMGDFGIGGYVYELSEGLCANGVSVDVYTGRSEMLGLDLPRRHSTYPVLGGLLFNRKSILKGESSLTRGGGAAIGYSQQNPQTKESRRDALKSVAASILLPIELALYLKRRKYDLIWTQWPRMDSYGTRFWKYCNWLGQRIVHTVHNVLPHERTPGDLAMCRDVYRAARALIVHSEYSKAEFCRHFPSEASKVIVAPHGLYTFYPRLPQSKDRIRKALNIRETDLVILFYGGVRPYKNIDAALEALKSLNRKDIVLVVAGGESGYPDLVPRDALGRTRRIAEQLGITEQVRLMPGALSLEASAEIFALSDILLLPYLESYGSGLLLLGMTYGKYIIASKAGGMDEYLTDYSRHTLLEKPEGDSIARAILFGKKQVESELLWQPPAMPRLEWKNIARTLLETLNQGGRHS